MGEAVNTIQRVPPAERIMCDTTNAPRGAVYVRSDRTTLKGWLLFKGFLKRIPCGYLPTDRDRDRK